MRPSFFIFSLPRSGSSWLSVFLTGPDSYCYHEPTADYTPQEWKHHAEGRKEPIVGAVDTAAYNYALNVVSINPDADFFALYRDPIDINRSSRAFGIHGFDAERERELLESLDFTPIFYSKFSDLGYLRHLWGQIIGTAFDEERAKQLKEMNVQRNFSQFLTHLPNMGRTYPKWMN